MSDVGDEQVSNQLGMENERRNIAELLDKCDDEEKKKEEEETGDMDNFM